MRDDLAKTRLPSAAVQETVEAEWVVDDTPLPPGAISRPPAPPGGAFFLVDLVDGHARPLRHGANNIGRDPANDVVLYDVGISRRHCIVTTDHEGHCEVKDAGSLNGIRVNGRKVEQATLVPGDVLSVFHHLLLLTWKGPTGEHLPPGTVRILHAVVPCQAQGSP